MEIVRLLTICKNLLSALACRLSQRPGPERRKLCFESLETKKLLSVSAGFFPLSTAETVSTVVTHNPDIDGDGFVGPGDYAIFSSRWYSLEDASNWNASCDIDGDGLIGPEDLSYVNTNWFKSVEDLDFVNVPRAAFLETSTSDFQSLTAKSNGTSEVLFTLTVVSQPTDECQVLKTGTQNFGTFYYLPEADVPASSREAMVDNAMTYLEVWVADTIGQGKFVSSLQFRLDYDPNQVVSIELEDIYAGKYSLSEFDYYDDKQACIKDIQITWLFSSSQNWNLIQPITNGENAWLLARFTVHLDLSVETTPAFNLGGVTDPVSPFVSGYYYVRTGDSTPVAESKIETVGIPSYSRLWAHSPDIDGNGIISTGDWGFLLAAWHTSPGDDAWNEDCDITGDGYIDDDDLAWLTDNWLEVCQ